MKQLNTLKSKVTFSQSIIRLTHILLSSLHIWSIDPALDKLFSDRLNLMKPKYPISFGRISRGAHLFVMFPPKRATFSFSKTEMIINTFSINNNLSDLSSLNSTKISKIPQQASFNLIDFEDSSDGETSSKSACSPNNETVQSVPETPSPTKEYWLSTKTITTEHLLAILSISNSFMHLQNFIDLQAKKE